MGEQGKLPSQIGEDGDQNAEEHCDNSIRINSIFSIEAVNPNTDTSMSKSNRSFPKENLMSFDVSGESVSAFTNTNASDSNNTASGNGIASEQSIGLSGPPSSIVQKLDDESSPLINLDSIQDSERESDVSDFNGIITKGDDNKTSWLNIDSSSTSQGSQGSYAHQVPALLGSYGSNGLGDQQSESFLSSQLSSPKNTTYHTAHSRTSYLLNLEAPKTSTLDEILGPKGEPMQYSLDSDGEPLTSDIDDILGRRSDGKLSDLDDTLGPYEGSTLGPSDVLPSEEIADQRNRDREHIHSRIIENRPKISLDNKIDTVRLDNFTTDSRSRATSIPSHDNIVNSNAPGQKGIREVPNYESGMMPSVLSNEVPEKLPISKLVDAVTDSEIIAAVQTRDLLSTQKLRCQSGPSQFCKSKSRLEPKGTDCAQTRKSSLDFASESSSSKACDRGDTKGDEILSHNSRLAACGTTHDRNLSPNSYSQKTQNTLSSDFKSDSYTYSSSQQGTLSTRGGSSMTFHVGGDDDRGKGDSRSGTISFSTEESNQSSPTEHSHFTNTQHTRDTQYTDTTSTNRTESGIRILQFSRGDSSQTSPTKHSQLSYTERTATSTNAISSNDDSKCFDDSRGGRMWREAQLEANNSMNRPLSPRAKKFAESIMARTRSRADPDALLKNLSNAEGTEKLSRSMIDMNTQEEGRFIESTGIARKRGRVVQLLVIGLLSFLIAFLGGFLVLSSCHFVSAAVHDEESSEDLNLHFGLWKFSPTDSAIQGYTYCSGYDKDFATDVPWFGRIFGLVALLSGAFSLGVLWIYLVLGRYVRKIWNNAICAAAFSGVLQLSTLSILGSRICKEMVCTLGPAGMISVVAGCFYFVLAFEMFYNTPDGSRSDGLMEGYSREERHHVVTNLEMTDFEYGAKAFVQRIGFGEIDPYHEPDRVQLRDQNRNAEINHDRANTSYLPPSTLL